MAISEVCIAWYGRAWGHRVWCCYTILDGPRHVAWITHNCKLDQGSTMQPTECETCLVHIGGFVSPPPTNCDERDTNNMAERLRIVLLWHWKQGMQILHVLFVPFSEEFIRIVNKTYTDFFYQKVVPRVNNTFFEQRKTEIMKVTTKKYQECEFYESWSFKIFPNYVNMIDLYIKIYFGVPCRISFICTHLQGEAIMLIEQWNAKGNSKQSVEQLFIDCNH